MVQLTGDETMAQIRQICKDNQDLKDIKMAGPGRTKASIIKEINEKVQQMQCDKQAEKRGSNYINTYIKHKKELWPEFEEAISAIPALDLAEHKRNACMLAVFLIGITSCVLYSLTVQ